MTGALGESNIDSSTLPSETPGPLPSSEAQEAQITNPEDMDNAIVADTTLTNDLSQHGFNVSHLKKDSIASSSDSGIIDVQAGSSEQDAVQRDARSLNAPTHEQADSDLDGGDLTQDVTFVAEQHDGGVEWLQEGRDPSRDEGDVTAADEILPIGLDIPSSSSPIRSQSRPGGLELNLEPPSLQPWDLVIPPLAEFDPTKTTGLSIPPSPKGYSPVASQKFSAMQASAG